MLVQQGANRRCTALDVVSHAELPTWGDATGGGVAGVSRGAAVAGGVSAAAGSVRSASESARARFSSRDLAPVSEGALSASSPSGLACYDVEM